MKTFLVLFFISGILIPNFIFAQYTQQGTKLVGEGAAGNAYQGSSVAISADGGTAIIGGFRDNNGTGAAWVFTRSNGVWTQQGQKLVGSECNQYSQFGLSAAISADGNTAVMGSPGEGNWGSAYIFTRSNGVWTQQGSKLVGSNSSQGASLGHAVAISADGNTVAIGGHNDDGGVGAVWVFTRSNGVWTQQGAKLTGSGGVGYTFYQGHSVSVSADGNTIVEGGYYDAGSQGAGQGAMWVFTRKNGVWSQQGPKLVSHESAVYASQGYSVAISGDGNTFVEGGPTNNGSEGGIWIFTRTDSVWTEQGGWLIGFGDIGNTTYPVLQGSSVAISADGNTVVEGGYGDNGGMGAVWVFTRTDGVWLQDITSSKLVGSGVVGSTIYQGGSVAISGDGKTILEGGNGDNNGVGAVWAFFNPITGVTEYDITTPSGFSLEQNYPNPFNPSTKINWQSPVSSWQTLKIYDVLGNEVSTLVDEYKLAGAYEVNFDASQLSSGIYFYKLQAGSFIETKKMIVIK